MTMINESRSEIIESPEGPMDTQIMKPDEYREDWGKQFKLLFNSLKTDPENYYTPLLYY